MHELQQKIIVVAAFMGALAVVLGAFGAHSLADYLSPKQLSTYQTGIDYHFFHSLALLGIANLPLLTDRHQRYLKLTYRLLVLGIIFFSFMCIAPHPSCQPHKFSLFDFFRHQTCNIVCCQM